MNWNPFSMNEKELKEFETKLNEREKSLNNKESDLNKLEDNIKHEKDLLKIEKNSLENQRKDLLKSFEELKIKEASIQNKMEELTKKEIEAKNGFAEKQKEAFKEVIEKRIAILDQRKKELDDFQKKLEIESKELNDKDGKISHRELVVTEREQKADANFADKAQKLAEEIKIQLEANKAEAERLKNLAEELANDRELIENTKRELSKREEKIINDEQIRDNGYSDKRIKLERELAEQKSRALLEIQNKKTDAEKEIAEYKENKISSLNSELLSIREKRMNEIENECDDKRKNNKDEIEASKASFKQEQDNWIEDKKKQENEINSIKIDLEKQKILNETKCKELESKEKLLEQEENRLKNLEEYNTNKLLERQKNVDDEVTRLVDEKCNDLKFKFESEKKEKEKLLRLLANQKSSITSYEAMKSCFGGKEPEEILNELTRKDTENRELREKLANSPSADIRERLESMTKDRDDYKNKYENLCADYKQKEQDIKDNNQLKLRISELETENSINAKNAKNFELAANQYLEELKRLRGSYQNESERSERIKAIKEPLKDFVLDSPAIIPAFNQEEKEKFFVEYEKAWLDKIYEDCLNYGFTFNKRILKACHTSLKSAEWSPLTVLAGVSGTGKSELPRLYSHFGGIMFQPLSVQPNWDCQESMLGFFNSIDNKFDAQPVLRFLAQSQEKWSEEYRGGLRESVCLVLLDEMNLAHPELYFAEFLSKLELRRGRVASNVPWLEVKIGAGITPFELPLGRNVLWVGTMNQDETTKSLSDKVLDRSIMIYFPRPTELKRRLKLNPLKEENRGKLLHNKVWSKWRKNESIFVNENKDKITEFKKFVESINQEALIHVGRALGHRVWQSIEYYMSNYPDVIQAFANGNNNDELEQAMHIAFEDQIVQKIMPKLRGIETRSESGEKCLDKIEALLAKGVNGNSFNLKEDFDLARELGYGQFMWQSANYLNESNSFNNSSDDDNSENTNNENSNNMNDITNIDLNIAPDSFMAHLSQQKKKFYWDRLTDEQKLAEYQRCKL